MKLPKNFLITLPRKGSAVSVHGINKAPFKAAVVSLDPPRMMRVRRLIDGEEFDVDYGQCTHAKA